MSWTELQDAERTFRFSENRIMGRPRVVDSEPAGQGARSIRPNQPDMARCLLVCLLLSLVAQAEPVEFVRITRDPRSVQTAITRYEGPKGVQVDLVAALHVADPDYYHELNRRFRGYDAVLFEGVIDSSRKDPPPPRSSDSSPARAPPNESEQPDEPPPLEAGHVLTGTQLKLAELLGLSFQLDEIDYGAKNFVHADLSTDEIARSMKKNNETSGGLFLRFLRASLNNAVPMDARTAAAVNVWLLTGEISPKDRLRVKRYLARVVRKANQLVADIGGTALIDARDGRVIQVLQKQLKQGKKRIAIFYGAGHMDDLDKRLREQLKLKRKSQDWVQSWSLD